MRKFTLILAATALSFGITAASVADEAHEHEEKRVEHYEATEVESEIHARTLLIKRSAEISAMIQAEEIAGSDLEKIHQISYTLENAIDKLITEKSAEQSRLDAVDEAVQAVHHASENHEEEKVREWSRKLASAIAALDEKEAAAEPAEKGVYEITIKDHTFTPDEIRVPVGEKIKLIVHNKDATPEEFESDDFRREKIIAGNSSATIFVGPLKPGKYHFFGEFNLDKANGYLIAE